MEYRITKENCAAGISGVCSMCGGQLSPIETVDNSRNPTFWPGCKECCRFENGVKPDVYRVAKAMVEDHGYRGSSYMHIDGSEGDEMKRYKLNNHISGACGVVRLVLSLM